MPSWFLMWFFFLGICTGFFFRCCFRDPCRSLYWDPEIRSRNSSIHFWSIPRKITWRNPYKKCYRILRRNFWRISRKNSCNIPRSNFWRNSTKKNPRGFSEGTRGGFRKNNFWKISIQNTRRAPRRFFLNIYRINCSIIGSNWITPGDFTKENSYEILKATLERKFLNE